MATSTQIEKSYQTWNKNRPKAVQMRNEIFNNQGGKPLQDAVKAGRKTLADIEASLGRVEGNVARRSRRLGGPVTQDIVDRLTSATRAPLLDQYDAASRGQEVNLQNLSDVNDVVSQILGLRMNEQSTRRDDFIRRITAAQSMEENARNRSANTQDNTALIKALFDLANSGNNQTAVEDMLGLVRKPGSNLWSTLLGM